MILEKIQRKTGGEKNEEKEHTLLKAMGEGGAGNCSLSTSIDLCPFKQPGCTLKKNFFFKLTQEGEKGGKKGKYFFL